MTPEELDQLVSRLKSLSESLSSEEPPVLGPARARRVRKTISEAYDKLRKVIEDLDPIGHPGVIFDPSNPEVVGRIVGITLIAQPRKPLASVQRFYGSGVYAIYYNGDFPAYRPISGKEHPIYVGKADPANPGSKTAIEQGVGLANRLLNDHRRSIAKASSTLRVEDFEYRALVVQTGWESSAEKYLIHLFKPIWNNEVGICYGIGKHGDAPTTRANQRSPWDTLHPGREWAHRDPKMRDAKPKAQILEEIKEHLRRNPPVASIDEILRRFLKEIGAVS